MSHLEEDLIKSKNLKPLERSRFYYRLYKNIFMERPDLDQAEMESARKLQLDDFFITSIKLLYSVADLYPMALSVRWGANPNMYVKYPGETSERHVLVYMLETLKRNRDQGLVHLDSQEYNHFIALIIVLMEQLGTNFSLPQNRLTSRPSVNPDPRITTSLNTIRDISRNFTLSLDNYVTTQGLYPQTNDRAIIFDGVIQNRATGVEIIKQNLSLEDKRLIALLCDEPQVMSNLRSFTSELDNAYLFQDILLARAQNIFACQPLSYKNNLHKLGVYTMNYHMAATACALDIYLDMLKNGVPITYFDVNYLIQRLSDRDLASDYFALLNEAVSSGVEIDTYQLNSAARVSDFFRSSLIASYTAPYYQKIQRATTGLIPHRLIELCFYLQISLENTKPEIIDNIIQIIGTDKNVVEDAFRHRYEMRLSSSFLPILVFSKPEIPILNIVNRQTLTKDPTLVNDHQTIVMEGGDKKLYAFNSDSFGSLTTKYINGVPIIGSITLNDGTPYLLPKLTQLEISKRLELLNAYDIDPMKVVTVGEAYDMLSRRDEINSDQTDIIINTMKTNLIGEGISIGDIKRNNLDLYIQPIYKNKDYAHLSGMLSPFKDLDDEHAMATFYRELYHLLRHDLPTYKAVVQVIKVGPVR